MQGFRICLNVCVFQGKGPLINFSRGSNLKQCVLGIRVGFSWGSGQGSWPLLGLAEGGHPGAVKAVVTGVTAGVAQPKVSARTV